MAKIKHLIVIHGRSTKPSETEKKRLTKEALLHGLSRVDSLAAKKFKDKKIKYTFIYYGDVNNREMIERKPSLRKSLTGENDKKYGYAPCVAKKTYDADLQKLFLYKQFTKNAYKRFLKNVPDTRAFDEIASVFSWLGSKLNFSDYVISAATADMGAYLLTRKVGSEIRERLQGPLKRALMANEDICLLSHSMGCIVSYDVLWKFSQMSEYKKIMESGNTVNLWLTLGNPLGEPGVKDNLYDAHEKQDGKYPRYIINNWTNISAVDDFVSHDSRIADDYKEMKDARYLNRLVDLSEIYTFWCSNSGANPHKFYGYLDNPTVAKQISRWIKS